MKKLVMLLLCVGLLSACSNANKYNVSVNDGKEVLISGDKIEISKNDYFEKLLDQYGAGEVMRTALTEIANKEITDESQIEELIKKRKETYAKYSSDGLSGYAKMLGYSTEDEFVEDALVPDAKQELLRNQYIDKNFDEYIEKYQVCSLKMITVDTESAASEIIKNATTEKKFDKQMEKNKDNSQDAGIVHKNSSALDDNLKTLLKDLSAITKDGVYEKAIKLSTGKYAVVYLYDTNHKNKDDIINSLTNILELQNEIEGIYLKKYNFVIHDKEIKNAVKKISEEYITD